MSSLENQPLSSCAMSEEEEAFGYAWCLRSSHAFTVVLDAAVQLGLFDILAKAAGKDAHLSPSDIASQLQTTNPGAASLVDRMLRLLACYDLVTCCISRDLGGDHEVERLYGLGLPGKAFVRDENGGSLAAFTSDTFAFASIVLDRQHLKDLVLEGANISEKVHGMPVYQYMSLNPERARAFDTAMVNLSKIIVKKVLEKYQGFEGISSLVDVGGGYGITLNMIISKYPSIKGINYDMPHVIQDAPSYPGKNLI